ncbi:DUF4190 domain-containing protein [Fimbriiglobus ruber]|uniref:DUF4190 domain-containing protein n=1 Tax=Fimbriiglobus ruber TaxID=1908690 RepID=A0A225DYD2_9BACT|nr:DUF4190 domain-containing protein [Fimbriiglobus ruber]OWK43548.1 hypothetical protein FRUB_03147 [Fimbriiglobus ruber]
MFVPTVCPACRTGLDIEAQWANTQVRCGACQEVFVAIPVLTEPPRPIRSRSCDEPPRTVRSRSRDDWNGDDDRYYDRPRRRPPRRPLPTGEGAALASLTLGIICLFIVCLWPIGMILSIVGMALGASALKSPSRKTAVAGLVLSTVGLIFTSGFAVVTVVAIAKAQAEEAKQQKHPRANVFDDQD